MAYYANGAWWTAGGQAYGSKAEAEAAEANSGAAGSDDAFAAAMGRNTASAVRAATRAPATPAAQTGSRSGGGTTAQPSTSGRGPQPAAPPATAQPRAQNPGSYQPGTGQAQAARDANTGFYEQSIPDIASGLYNNPVTNPIGWAATQAGSTADRAVGNVFDRGIDAVVQAVPGLGRANVRTDLRPSVSGYIQDPVGQIAADFGAPDLVQAIANPTGFATRTAVNAGTGYGINVPQAVRNSVQAGGNIVNDIRNTPGTIAAGAGAVANAANAAGGYLSDVARRVGAGIGNAVGGGGGGAPIQAQQIAQPTPSMTPQSIMGISNVAARPSSAQSDAIVQQMMNQANVQSAYQDFNSPQYDASRGAAMGYTSQLAGLANNNVAITGLNGDQYNNSRGSVMDSVNQLNSNASRDVRDIYADTTNSLQSRQEALNSQQRITAAAGMDVNNIYGARTQMDLAGREVDGVERLLRGEAEQGAQLGRFQDGSDATRGAVNDVLARLLAASEMPDDQSAAQALMLNAQERATRNAYGDAGSLSGGWRSQLTGQRQAMGRAAALQTDIAAQMGALRAQETQQNRQRQLEALGLAGGQTQQLGGIDQREMDAALGDQALDIQALNASGQLGLGRMGIEGDFSTADANRNAVIAQGNQQNRLAGHVAAGTLAAQIQGLDQDLSIADANRLAVIAQGNQQNRLNSLLGAGQLGLGQNQNDLGFATNDAQIRTQRELANQQNALNAMLGAANAANQTAGIDANIGMNNANNRVTVDQNNRANSIAALQNAGVLSSTIRGQDVQLSLGNQQALSSQIASAAGLSGTIFSSQMQAAIAQGDQNLRAQQLELLRQQQPTQMERYLSTAGDALGLLGLVF